MPSPSVSVIVAVYNVQAHAQAAIDSLKAQTFTDFEAIVVNDGSTDDSGRVLRDAIKQDARFTLIDQDNMGLSGARNTGLDRACGDFVAFLDGDDRYAPDFLSELHGALTRLGGDWASCGIKSVHPDGTSWLHTSIHHEGFDALAAQATRRPLDSWDAVIRHFPSAWNKLYRRDLIEGLRFEDGTWFEDHGYYTRAAARTDHLIHVPKALYLQSRDRPGQITGTDSDRVFEIFGVLDDLKSVMQAKDRAGADSAFARITSRLIFERSGALRDPDRRARFATASCDYLDRHALRFEPEWKGDGSAAWELEMTGALPLSVVIPCAGASAEAVQTTLADLSRDPSPGREVVVVCGQAARDSLDPIVGSHPQARLLVAEGGAGTACNAGIAAATGEYIQVLFPGDRPVRGVFAEVVDDLISTGAQMALSAYFDADGTTRSGFHGALPDAVRRSVGVPVALDFADALNADARLSAKIWKRSLIEQTGVRFDDGPLPAWRGVLQAILAADRLIYHAYPYVRLAPTTGGDATAARRLARAVDRFAKGLPADLHAQLPEGWWRRLYARAVTRSLAGPGLTRLARRRLAVAAGLVALQRGVSGQRTPLDSDTGPWLERLMSGAAILRRAGSADTGGDATVVPLGWDAAFRPFSVDPGDRLAMTVDFRHGPYANLYLLNETRTAVLFHISLRQQEGQIVSNTFLNGSWGKETAQPATFPDLPFEIELAFEPPKVNLLMSGQVLLRTGGVGNRARASHLDRVAVLATQGGIEIDAPIEARPTRAPKPQVKSAPDTLELDDRLDLAAWLPRLAPEDAQNLSLTGFEDPARPVIQPHPQGGTLVTAPLPGRVWRDVDAQTPLTLTLADATGAPAAPPLTLTRAHMAQRLDTALLRINPLETSNLAITALEHAWFADLGAKLTPATQEALSIVAEGYKLQAFRPALPAATGRAVKTLPNEIQQAQILFARSLQERPGADTLKVMERVADTLPDQMHKAFYLSVTDHFCGAWDDFDRLYASVRARYGANAMSADWSDRYNRSSVLPYLLMDGRGADLVRVMGSLNNGDDWIATPTIAWVMRRIMRGDLLHEEDRERVVCAYDDVMRQWADDYWERTPCKALTEASVLLVTHRTRLPDRTQDRIFGHALYVYGMSLPFWTRLEETFGADGMPPELAPYHSAFVTIRRTTDAPDGTDIADPQVRAKVEAAFETLRETGCPALPQARREILGAGTPAARPRPLAPDTEGKTLQAERLLRAAAFPGSPAPDADTARTIAAHLPEFYTKVQRAPYLDSQQRLSQTCTHLIAEAGDRAITAGDIADIAPDLRVLAGVRSRFLGQGLVLALLRAFAGDARHAPACEALFDLLEAMPQDAAPPDPTKTRARRRVDVTPEDTLHRAAAPRLGLLALRDDPNGAHLFGRASTLLPGLAETLPERHEGTETQGLDASPIYDCIVTIFSCVPNLDTRVPPIRDGWVTLLRALEVPYVFVVGGGDGRVEGDVLHVDADDSYEGLPQKTLATIKWIHDNTHVSHMFKIDDDCFLNAPVFFGDLSYRKFDYYGRILKRQSGQTDRAWHNAKSSTLRGRFELDKSPEPSTYTDGGSAYALSRTAMAAAIRARATPEGQRLETVSFMEDKLLGDLLALEGISPSDEDYRMSQRRHNGPGRIPVGRWVNSFMPSRSAPVSVVHLDKVEDQAPAMARLTTRDLTPSRVWPSYQDAALVYQSNALELMTPTDRLDAAREADVAVVAALRNEMFMLPRFLHHYRKLGVGHFLIADNCSTDGTLEYLIEQPDVSVFSVDTDYAESHYGVAWQQALVSNFRVGRWSLLADADELLVWEKTRGQTLPELVATPAFAQADAARIFMLDMYPRGTLAGVDMTADPFAQAGFAERDPFLTNWPGRGPFSNMTTWTSALRHRLIPGSRPDLFVAQKIALLRYRPYMSVSAGLHYAAGMTLAPRELIFGHFKYNAHFHDKAREEVARGQHFNGAEEYRRYLDLLAEGRDAIHDPRHSAPWDKGAFVQARLGAEPSA